jgi:hypothetical protein
MNLQSTERKNYSNTRYNKEPLIKKALPKEYSIKQEDFPNLFGSSELTREQYTSNNNKIEYAKIAVKEIQTINPNYDDIFGVLEPGLLYLKYDKENRKIIRREGPKTEYAVKMEQKMRMENDLTYRMNQAIKEIDIRRQKYIEYYEYMNGEGSYEEFYKIQQNTIEDSDDDDDDEDNISIDDEIY